MSHILQTTSLRKVYQMGMRRNAFNLVDLGEIQIRGKAAPVRIWAIKL